MKTLLHTNQQVISISRNGLLVTLLLIAFATSAQKHENLITGTWRFANQSAVNDFQQVLNTAAKDSYTEEYFVFEPGSKFLHQFVDKAGRIVKTLVGKWKAVGDKIAINYSDVNYTVKVNYFFLDKDLVLGQDFNHVIFTRGSLQSQNIAQK